MAGHPVSRDPTGIRWLGGGRSPLVVVLLYVTIAAAAGTGLAWAAGDGRVLRRLHDFDPIWLLVCLGAEMLAYVGYVFALRETARVDDGPQLSYGHAFRVVAAGFGAFFAGSASGGFEIDYLALRHAGATRRQAVARVLGLSTLEYAVLAPAALTAAMVLTFGEAFGHRALTLPWLLVVPGFAVAFWLSSPKRDDRFGYRDHHNVLRRGFCHAVAGLRILRRLLRQPFRHGLGFVGVCLYWFGDLACLWGALMTFGAHVDVLRLLLAYATGYVVSRRGLPAGGVGVAEVLLTFAFVWLGVGFAPALLAVFGYRIFNLWLALVPAYAVQPTVARLRRDLPDAHRDAALAHHEDLEAA
jgi:uncharacterized membrane protein YbhN (UPF0104 family)